MLFAVSQPHNAQRPALATPGHPKARTDSISTRNDLLHNKGKIKSIESEGRDMLLDLSAVGGKVTI